jgi:1-deoxy-D-xylulose-5-phosphate reductoisomerase
MQTLSLKASTRSRVCILGATGSIGASTLDVLAHHPEQFEVFALTAHARMPELQALCLRWNPAVAVVSNGSQAQTLQTNLRAVGSRTEVLFGPQALAQVAAHHEVDMVMAAIVGAAGLEPCLAAARAGKRLLLANKEALVVGGALFMQAVEQGGATLLPIDSEHSAIFQCLPENRDHWHERIDHIVLTASGGPFRQRSLDTLPDVTPEQACKHPNWTMGQKISVDSATMMNKALEVIEARWLFDLQPEQIRVVIHPQSIVHSMVVYRDHSMLAQMGTPDMRGPIAYGLSFPQRMTCGASMLDLSQTQNLSFEPVDYKRFPGLLLAWQALSAPAGSTAILNASNEVAVAAFLEKRIRFDQIHAINAQTLQILPPAAGAADALEGLLALDQEARVVASQMVRGYCA